MTSEDPNHALDKRMLDHAAKAAWRGQGSVEPNPMVGCVIGTPAGQVLAVGHHREFGGAHAEVDALQRCKALGHETAGATAWVTLEPCSHQGKTPPCAKALIEAKVAQVVIALQEPGDVAKGGASMLREAGIEVRFTDASRKATLLNQPYVKRMATGLPWITAKWAQTIDARIATRTGESQWISNERSRAEVHRLRGRVDVIMTGVGTVRTDDPSLTARGQSKLRRTPKRVVIDPTLRTPLRSKLVQTAAEVPTMIACEPVGSESRKERASALEAAGVTLLETPLAGARLDLQRLMRTLAQDHDAANVMVESGPGLMGSLHRERLIDEYWVFAAPLLLGDSEGMPALHAGPAPKLADAQRLQLIRIRRFGDDALMIYRKPAPVSSEGVSASS